MSLVGESEVYIASCNIFAGNNNLLQDFPERFLFAIKMTSGRKEYMYDQGGQALSIQIQYIVQKASTLASFFFKSILLFKNGTKDGYATNYVIARAGFTLRGALALYRFLHHLAAKYRRVAGRNWSCLARANAAITQITYQIIYPSEPNSERFNLFLCHVFAMYQRCSISASFEWFRFPKRMVFYLFLSVGAQAQVSSFEPNFDVVRTKEAEMETVYSLFWAWRKRVCRVFKSYTVCAFSQKFLRLELLPLFKLTVLRNYS